MKVGIKLIENIQIDGNQGWIQVKQSIKLI